MSTVWNTKYGKRRVRFDPPTLKEAIAAAPGLTDDVQQQAEIAAALMDLPVGEVRAELLKLAPPRNSTQIVTSNGREGVARTVIVERKASRRAAAGAAAVKAGLAKTPDQAQPQPGVKVAELSLGGIRKAGNLPRLAESIFKRSGTGSRQENAIEQKSEAFSSEVSSVRWTAFQRSMSA